MGKILLHKKKKSSDEVQDFIDHPSENDLAFITRKINVDLVVSTGSTLLDLAISGKRRRGGGVPGGIIVEAYGPSGSGKTSVLQEIISSCQINGGDDKVLDPEGRLDAEYARIYAVKLNAKNYSRPDTVEEVFAEVQTWKPTPKEENAICVIGTDSLAALSTELEMSPKGDKMGMKRAKDFSAGFRKTARIIANNNWLMFCTNQVRQSDYGEVVPGGNATAFYSSLRMRIKKVDEVVKSIDLKKDEKEEKKQTRADKIREEKEKEKKTNIVEKVLGIKSTCHITKSTIDDPYREVDIYIMFGYGIDDVRGNLQYIKNMTNATVYDCTDGKTYQSIDKAISYIEQNNLQEALRENTIDLWEKIEAMFDTHRAPKTRR